MKPPLNYSPPKNRRLRKAWRGPGQRAKGLVFVLATGLLGIPARTADTLSDSLQHLWKEATTSVQFGGFVSQGLLVNTGKNDYLGRTSDGTADFREYGVNASYAIGQFRFGMQVFGQKLGEYGDDKMGIDWATVDYQPAQWFGVRAGRVKMPRGLYNEALDLDSVRPFVLLPQSVYDARLRDFNAAFNGGMVFGNIGLKKLGSLDYRVFYGDIPIDDKSGANDYFNNDFPSENLEIEMDSVRGGSLFWSTPVTGLRVGYSYSSFENLSSLRRGTIQFAPPPAPALTVLGTKATDRYERQLVSIEYITGNWVFAAEAGREHAIYHVFLSGVPLVNLDFESNYFYVSAARRITPWLELGAYYSYSRDTEPGIGPSIITAESPLPALEQHDFALSARFDINEHLIFKVEAHYMDGAGKIFDTIGRPQPFAARDESWFLFGAKVTYSF